jgi:hypothetical protein
MVTSLPLCHFCPTVNYMPWLPQIHQLKIVGDVTQMNPNQCWAMPKIIHPTHNFESQPFWNGWSYGIKHYSRGPLEWHHMPTKPHANLPIGSKVDEGNRQTRRQDGDLISLFPLLGSRLKTVMVLYAQHKGVISLNLWDKASRLKYRQHKTMVQMSKNFKYKIL